jgi:beta-lactam-binding protein with PASTA domain/tRNA A-37 threonylcarbamoyl transferase component Bud32
MTQLADVFSNRYEIQRGIARGGMAEVYLARDQLLDRPVAVKVLFPEYARDPSFVERFRREAQSAAGLNHPNIVAIYDWGQERGTYFIVMEYVRGRSLREVVQVNGPFSARRTAEIGADIAGALEFAHRNGVVHRDVKPGNVLLTADGDVKVTDFGIARAGTSDALTQTGAVMGTATYFSPEQAQGLDVDGRSDVYSLGVVLYEMATGVPPFTGESPVAVAYKHVREQPERPSVHAPDLPPDLERIILTAMSKDIDSRYQTADELRTDLLRFVRGQPPLGGPVAGVVAGETAGAGAARPQVAYAPVPPSEVDHTREARRKRLGAIVAGLLGTALIAAVIIGLVAFGGGGGGGGGGPTAEVPNVISTSFPDAERILKLTGFKVDRNDVEGKDPPDLVLSQKPGAGEKLKKNGTVVLRVSKATFTMPSLAGKQRTEAVNVLIGVGLQDPTNNVQTQEVDSDQPPGSVLGSDPPAGAQVPKVGKVVLQIAKEPNVAVPNVAGQEAATAQQLLQGEGFQVSAQSEPSDTAPTGRVTRTDPGAGAQVRRGSAIRMFVSTGPQNAEVPNVVGQPQGQAAQTLQADGFQVFASPQRTNNPLDQGRVLAQNPSAGQQVPRGSGVTLTVGNFRAGGGNGGGD